MDAAWAAYEQAAAGYEQAVLGAFSDASRAITRHAAERRRLDATTDALASARQSYDAQLSRYGRGIGDYLAVLDAELNLIRARTAESSATRALALARLNVHRALGGAWVQATVLPEDRMPTR